MNIQTGTGVMRKAMKLLLWLTMLLGGWAHAGTVTYVYTDPQGTPLAEADASGNITATFDYAPYGSQALGTPPDGPGYTGHVNDPESGLVYMQARYYDPSAGRFVSTDPQGPSAGNFANFNRFAYANNNPVSNIDRNGRQSLPVSNELGTTDPHIIYAALGAQAENAGKAMNVLNSVTEPLMFAYPELDAGELLGGLSRLMGFGRYESAVTMTPGLEVPLAAPVSKDISTFRMTAPGETFFHYSQESYGASGSFAGGLRPGGFATSMGNLSGFEAQSGLALPQALPPNAVYTVTPEAGTWVNVNPFADAKYGQPGGLPEYQFPRGTGTGTVSQPRKLDDN